MIQSGDPAILCAASFSLPSVLGRIEDFDKDMLRISEEELLGRAKEYLALLEQRDNNERTAPDHFAGIMSRTALQWADEPLKLDDDSPEYRMIPAYNAKGGVTASVSCFTAINRNTQYPDLAFKVVNYLLGKNIQGNSSLYRGNARVPGIGQQKRAPGWDLVHERANFQEYQGILQQINQVRFSGPIDVAISDINTIPGVEEKELEKSVHEQYTLMQMLLAES